MIRPHTPTITPAELVNVWQAWDDRPGSIDAARAMIRAIDQLVGWRHACRFRDLLTRHRQGGRVHHYLALERALEDLARVKAELRSGVVA